MSNTVDLLILQNDRNQSLSRFATAPFTQGSHIKELGCFMTTPFRGAI